MEGESRSAADENREVESAVGLGRKKASFGVVWGGKGKLQGG